MLRFGPYEVHEELGRGGMGVVYRGFDPMIRRDVALKTIKLYDISDQGERRQMQERLEREAQSAGRLSHPNIVTIYQVGYAEIRPGETLAFIAMEYVPGRTLAGLLEKARVKNHELALKLLRQAAEGLDYAHSQGVIHRDVKPANLLITNEGRLKITDFGVAKLVSHTMTMTGTVLGSPFYMSPEQIRADRVDGRSDQYALAVVAYEVFGGRKPFQAETLSALVYKIAHEEPPLLELESETLARRLNPVLRRAMAKEPGERFPDCVAMVEALEKAYAEPLPVSAPPVVKAVPPQSVAPPKPAPQAPKAPAAAAARHVPWMGVTAALGVVVLMAGGVWILRDDGAPAAKPAEPAAVSEPVEAPPPRVESRQRETVKSEPRAAATAPVTKVNPAPPPQKSAAEPAKVAAEQVKAVAPAEVEKRQAPAPVVEPEPPPPTPPPAPKEVVRTQPKLLQRVPAAYTNEARTAGIEGSVHLSVDIDERGIPVRARILKSLDHGLDRNAIQSLGGWRFQPATEDGKPVGSTANVEVQFQLVGAPTKQAPRLKSLKQ